MSDNYIEVDVERWINNAPDEFQRLERQASDLFLNALAQTPTVGDTIFLKGGVLMGLVYGSFRQTADLDFTSTLPPTSDINDFRSDLDLAMRRVAPLLGYPDLVCKVQTIKKRPRPNLFEGADFPALELSIGYAIRGTREEESLARNNSSRVLRADISYREDVYSWDFVRLGENGALLRAYSVYDLIAEKLRALLQQIVRNRRRRQDVYDLAFILEDRKFDEGEKEQILRTLKKKCATRSILPDINSLSDPKVEELAREDWDTLKLELDVLPKFDDCFAIVTSFYSDLPWNKV